MITDGNCWSLVDLIVSTNRKLLSIPSIFNVKSNDDELFKTIKLVPINKSNNNANVILIQLEMYKVNVYAPTQYDIYCVRRISSIDVSFFFWCVIKCWQFWHHLSFAYQDSSSDGKSFFLWYCTIKASILDFIERKYNTVTWISSNVISIYIFSFFVLLLYIIKTTYFNQQMSSKIQCSSIYTSFCSNIWLTTWIWTYITNQTSNYDYTN
jgi:hypothetical protein